MKYLIILFFSFVVISGCKETVEVIPNYDEIYLPLNKVDKTPQLKEGDEKILSREINKEINNSKDKENAELDYKLLIDEEGNVDKVEVVKSPGKNYTSLVVNRVKDWKFVPAEKEGKKVKSQYRWYFNISAQNGSSANINKENYLVTVEEMPQIIGGISAIQKKIVYPEIAKRAGIEGKVYVRAFIDKAGNVVAADIIKGVGSGLNEAAVSAVKQTKFTPGKQAGKPVNVQVVIPISFKLN